MLLSIGTRFNPYEILDPIGKSEEYRALDTKLGREVAIKILPQSFRIMPSVWSFEWEAKVLVV